MLCELLIKKFAIIDDIKINFSPGLTILSGETGAGKTIIVQAVNLILGARASSKMIRTGSKSAEIQAFFEISQPDHKKIMKDLGFDYSEGLIIKRIISLNNRHKIYINDSLATMSALNKLTENLASISGQHAYQGLLKDDRHLLILDEYGDLLPLREKVSSIYKEIVLLIETLKKLEKKQKEQKEHLTLLRFQADEIEKTEITIGEDVSLEQEKTRLKNSETIYRSVHGAIENLYISEGAVIERLIDTQKSLDQASKFDPVLENSASKIEEAVIMIQDISESLQTYIGNIQFDNARLEAVEERLNALLKVKRKYGGTLESVLSYLKDIKAELENIGNISEEISDIRYKIASKRDKLIELCKELSVKRSQTAVRLAQKVEKEVAQLKMDKTRFKAALTSYEDTGSEPTLVTEGKVITETGIDRAEFQIAPNVGEALKPLTEIASGGELSRVILALKVVLADKGSIETVVFDEVDAGIGGRIGDFVGKKLKELSLHHQIICITHLPQIARFGDNHLKISKRVKAGRTQTCIEPITDDKRVKEIAAMLGGENITEAVLKHAKELLNYN